jgi:drug/metabolite transporter (DMT)-like permease
MTRVIVAMCLAGLSAGTGQTFLRVGAQQIGEINDYALGPLLSWFGSAVANPWMITGTALNAVCYGFLIAALSWTSATIVLPLSALEYGFAALLAVAWLGEAIPPLRWAGICVVIVGVLMIGAGGGA